MNISRFTTLVLISIFLIPSNASAHCKGKHSGDHPHCTGGGGNSTGDYTSSNSLVDFISPSDVAGYDYHIVGTPDQEEIVAGSGSDLIEAGASNDSVFGRGNHDEIYGGNVVLISLMAVAVTIS